MNTRKNDDPSESIHPPISCSVGMFTFALRLMNFIYRFCIDRSIRIIDHDLNLNLESKGGSERPNQQVEREKKIHHGLYID